VHVVVVYYVCWWLHAFVPPRNKVVVTIARREQRAPTVSTRTKSSSHIPPHSLHFYYTIPKPQYRLLNEFDVSGVPLNLDAGGENEIHIDVSEGLPGRWCVEVGWVALELLAIEVNFAIQNRRCLKIDDDKTFRLAIFGTPNFDVGSIDASTIKLNGLQVKRNRRGNKYACSADAGDVNDDGIPDLVCCFVDDLSLYEPINFCEDLVPTWRSEAQTVDGLAVIGRGEVCLAEQPIPTSGPIVGGACGDNVVCTPGAVGRTCACDPGYELLDPLVLSPESSCVDVDECAAGTSTCVEADGELCVNTEGSFRCFQCPNGYEFTDPANPVEGIASIQTSARKQAFLPV
jgi:hypothetical protein